MASRGNEWGEPLEGGSKDWWFDAQAECTDPDSEGGGDADSDSDRSAISDLVNDVALAQGNSRELLNNQEADADARAVRDLKRKYVGTPTPSEVCALSPRLASVSITPPRKGGRRRLFDSGLGHETEDSAPRTEVEDLLNNNSRDNGSGGGAFAEALMRSCNWRAKIYGTFKDHFGVSFSELTRLYKSNKTCNGHWVAAVCGAREERVDAAKTLLEDHCAFYQIESRDTPLGIITLFLFEFRASKSRDTLQRLLKQMLDVGEFQMLSDPPRLRSVAAALHFLKRREVGGAFSKGCLPDWIAKNTMVSHQSASADTFDFSQFVQCAYDNNWNDEAQAAFYYAQMADDDQNAAAFLRCTNQVKLVRDAVAMCRLYKRQQMRDMPMAQWVAKCCAEAPQEGDWQQAVHFLRYQGVNFVEFLGILRSWFKGLPKKNCILVHGPADTGKSTFCTSLVTFLRGRVISHMNLRSNFWLSPLVEAKVGYLDDVTMPCWRYMDENLRTALDGNAVSIDVKHRAPVQMKVPPLLMTSNYNVTEMDQFKYLHSRITGVHFPNPMPLDDMGNPLFDLSDGTWNSFFKRLQRQLDLEWTEEDEGDDGEALRAFRCTARQVT